MHPMVSTLADFQQTLHFSSDCLPEDEKIAIWRELYGQKILRLDIEPLPDCQFNANLRLRTFPGLRLVSGRIAGARDRRTRALMTDGNDDFGFALNWGDVSVSQCGRQTALNEGDAILLSCSDIGTVSRPSPSRYIGLRIPRAVLMAQIPDIEDKIGQPIPRTVTLTLLQSYVASLFAADEPVAAEFQHLAVSHTYDLVALALGARGDVAAAASNRGLRAARLSAIKIDIAGHLGNRTLTIGALANRHGITPRYIQKLFEDSGASFTNYVLGQRLARVYRLLTDPRHVKRTISAIAFEVGFGDLSYFNRAFRRHFGETPSSVREAARNGRN
jgi:AraC-like DNA-binding protein